VTATVGDRDGGDNKVGERESDGEEGILEDVTKIAEGKDIS
jgi:hypothetical protein